MPIPPSGWYRDRRNPQMMRWWDGQHWTDHTRPAGSPATAPPVLATSPPVPAGQSAAMVERRSWWKAPWLLLVVAGIGFGIAVGAGIGGATSTSASAGATVTETATATVDATVTATPVISKVVATRTQTATVTFRPTFDTFGEGIYEVGTDIKPGRYHTAGGSGCYWARLSSLDTTKIVDNSTDTGPQTIEIFASDKAFEVRGACTFGRV